MTGAAISGGSPAALKAHDRAEGHHEVWRSQLLRYGPAEDPLDLTDSAV